MLVVGVEGNTQAVVSIECLAQVQAGIGISDVSYELFCKGIESRCNLSIQSQEEICTYFDVRPVVGIKVDVQYGISVQEIEEDLATYRERQEEKARYTIADRDPSWPEWVKTTMVRKINNLPCKNVVQDMTLEGFPTVEIARQIQALGHAKDVSLAYLTDCVKHFKQTIPKSLIVQRLSPQTVIKAAKAIEAGVCEMDEMSDLYLKIKGRIEFALAREKELGAMIPGTEKMFGPAVELLKARADLKEKLGFQGNKPVEVKSTKVDWDSIYSRPGMNDVMSDPKARYRIVKFVESLSSICTKVPAEQQVKMLESALRTIKKDMPKREPGTLGETEDLQVIERAIEETAQVIPRKVIMEEPLVASGVKSRREPG